MAGVEVSEQPADCYLSELYTILSHLLDTKPAERPNINSGA